MAEESRAKILASLLPFMAYEYGPQFVRDLWKRSDCKWEQFANDGSIDRFVEQNVIFSFFVFSIHCISNLLFKHSTLRGMNDNST